MFNMRWSHLKYFFISYLVEYKIKKKKFVLRKKNDKNKPI